MNGPTPGDWIIHPSNPELVISKRTGQVIADCDQDPASEQRVANARLCAAAPDLLETLRVIVGQNLTYFNSFVMSDQIAYSHIMAARAAVSKAEGKS